MASVCSSRIASAFATSRPNEVSWYQEHADWVAGIRTREYLKYYEKHYGKP